MRYEVKHHSPKPKRSCQRWRPRNCFNEVVNLMHCMLQGRRSVISSGGGGLSAEGTICERRGRETSRGSGGILPRQILKSRVSEMPFPALWGQNLQNSNRQKTAYKMSKFTCSLDRIIFQNVITGAVFVVNTLCNCFLIILTTPTLHEKAAKHKPYNASVLTS